MGPPPRAAHHMIPPAHASMTDLRRMFFTDFIRIDPAASRANPACIRKTREAANRR